MGVVILRAWPVRSYPTLSGSESRRCCRRIHLAPEVDGLRRTTSVPSRHHLRAQDGHSVGGPPARGLRRLGDDLLAQASRLGGRLSVGEVARATARRAASAQEDGLVSRLGGFLQRPGAEKGGHTGPNPTDRAKAGSKHFLLVDRRGNPLAVRLTAANVNDVGQLLALVDAVPPIRGRRGRPLRRPTKLHADKGFASRANRLGLRRRGITPRIARPGIDSRQKLGRHRWKVEQRLAHLHRFRRLRIRDERRADIHLALLHLAMDLMLFRARYPVPLGILSVRAARWLTFRRKPSDHSPTREHRADKLAELEHRDLDRRPVVSRGPFDCAAAGAAGSDRGVT